jgi:glucoside 3-dehydrogenase (cytochrome c) hitch-hiker subunit
MQRRELIQLIAALTGCAFVGRDALWAAADSELPPPYSDADVDFLGEVADTILPTTETPGARDAAVGAFMARYSAACYPPEHIALLKSGIADIDAQMQIQQGKGFRQADEQAKISLLTQIDRQAKEKTREDAPHYFTLMKQLTLYGFFTSEPGATRVARYRPVPGKYRGCIPYVKGETFWAW